MFSPAAADRLRRPFVSLTRGDGPSSTRALSAGPPELSKPCPRRERPRREPRPRRVPSTRRGRNRGQIAYLGVVMSADQGKIGPRRTRHTPART